MAKKSAFNRAVDGVLLLDKPAGLTSNDALQRAKRLLRARKAGHTGSLDPIATGLLPLCFGEATKISRFLLEADKRYRTTFRLGEITDTGDSQGEVTERRPVNVTRRQIERSLARFEGEIEQVPPMYSAIKRGGQPLYKLARQGIEVEREARRVRVEELRVIDFREGEQVELEIACGSGFYVRSFAHDLGELLGCGAHVAALRRLAVGGFDVSRAITLEQLEAAGEPEDRDRFLLSTDEGLAHLPEVTLSRDAAYYLCRGQSVRAEDTPRSGWVRLYTETQRFLGVGVALGDGRVAPKRLLQND